jgi:hypothetical protein
VIKSREWAGQDMQHTGKYNIHESSVVCKSNEKVS